MEKKPRAGLRVTKLLLGPARGTQATGPVPAANNEIQASSVLRTPSPFTHPTLAVPSLETALVQLQWDLQDGMSEAWKHRQMPLPPCDDSTKQAENARSCTKGRERLQPRAHHCCTHSPRPADS